MYNFQANIIFRFCILIFIQGNKDSQVLSRLTPYEAHEEDKKHDVILLILIKAYL